MEDLVAELRASGWTHPLMRRAADRIETLTRLCMADRVGQSPSLVDLNEKLQARVNELERARVWRSMRTAPLDGTPVYLVKDGVYTVGCYARNFKPPNGPTVNTWLVFNQGDPYFCLHIEHPDAWSLIHYYTKVKS